MRILFDLIYPGYLRYYDAPIKQLAARGHEVEVWFVNDRKVPEGLRALDNESRVHVGGRRPRAEPELATVPAIRATGDYLRYLDPAFAEAGYLRRRVALKIPVGLRWLARLDTLPGPVARRLVAASLRLDEAAPVSHALAQFLQHRSPDVVVAGPAVYAGGAQADLLDAARAARIPTVAAPASWDNLTTKGLLRGRPDRVLVWNKALADEAIQLHQVPPERVHVTGAPPFDKWFGREPTTTAEEFAERVGLPPDKPYVLFVGSTARILAPRAEMEFVRSWITAMRASDDPLLRDLGVIVRPHPYSRLGWAERDLSDLPAATIWPRGAANPVDEGDRSEYFDSIHHSVAVVGINTSAMIEAAIIGRPVFTVTPPEFAGTQTGTLHFQHLLPEHGGFVRQATSIPEHLAQLQAGLRDPDAAREELHAFVSRFIRPLGLDKPATDAFVAQIEAAGASPPLPVPQRHPFGRLAWMLLEPIGRLDRRFGSDYISTRLTRRAHRHREEGKPGAWSLEQTARLLAAVSRELPVEDARELDV